MNRVNSIEECPDPSAHDVFMYCPVCPWYFQEPEDLIEGIARVVHEANRLLQVAQNDPRIPVSSHWDSLSQETKNSAKNGVQGVLDGNTPEQSHQNWMKFKKENGWTWGAVKDEVAKTHPNMLEYDQLLAVQKLKDDQFVNIVKLLAKNLGLYND